MAWPPDLERLNVVLGNICGRDLRPSEVQEIIAALLNIVQDIAERAAAVDEKESE